MENGVYWLRVLLVMLSIIGYGASIAGFIEYRSTTGVCELDGIGSVAVDCASVYEIPQAMLLGRFHLSEIAPIYFTLVGLSAVALWVRLDRISLYALGFLLAIGVLSIPYLVYLELFVARAICLWCTVMHLAIISIAVLWLMLVFRVKRGR